MIIVCKKGTKKLVKNLRYEVKNLWNNGQNQSWLEGKVELKGLSGRYNVNKFNDTNGNSVAKINHNEPVAVVENLKFSDLKEGDILVCKVDTYKTMIKGGMYKVEKLETYTYTKGVGLRNWTYKDEYVKFEGIKRKLKFNPWRFRKLAPKEIREIQLGSLLEGKDPDIIKTTKINKIDKALNKEKVLMETLSKSILDSNRHQLSILEWACEKSGEHLGITEESYKELLEMPLKEILIKVER